uniref:Aa_trans domain-containing protein n=1 Tax=Rhabditophanes sp. KR3021 TaxID=114890 RepID=A0AC35U359_9BILA
MTSGLTSNDELAITHATIFRENTPITRMRSASELTIDDGVFRERTLNSNSITSNQAFVHMIKAMLGTGLLSLPLAFKHSGLYMGILLIGIICGICLYCMRQVIHASNYLCARDGIEVIDFANVMRKAVESVPRIRHWGYFSKQSVNVAVFVAQLGLCCVYFVFMADNLEDFFTKNTSIHLPKSIWMMLAFMPIMTVCSIRNLKVLAPLALAANFIYLAAICIVLYFCFTNLKSVTDPSIDKWGSITNLPLFFGTVIFSFEGTCVILPIENRMRKPHEFIKSNGVLNLSGIIVLLIFAIVGFFGYLATGAEIKDSITLNLPDTVFYQVIKLMFVSCIMVSFPLQFYVPMERVEKWITRKVASDKQLASIYFVRFSGVIGALIVAELIPHLALFISLIGSFSGSLLALLFPPVIDLLISYDKNELTSTVIGKNVLLFCFFIIGFTTGTYSALSEIFAALAS